MRQIVSYLRISTCKQGKSGLGIEARRETIARFKAAEGFGVLADVVEVETGKGADALYRRPKLAEALAKARKARASAVVAKLCRLSRDLVFISSLMTQRVFFIVAELGAEADHFMLHIYAASAKKVRGMISDKARGALAVKKAEGATLGNLTKLGEAQANGADANPLGCSRRAKRAGDLHRAGRCVACHHSRESLDAGRLGHGRGRGGGRRLLAECAP